MQSRMEDLIPATLELRMILRCKTEQKKRGKHEPTNDYKYQSSNYTKETVSAFNMRSKSEPI